jgi:hypothetical protein
MRLQAATSDLVEQQKTRRLHEEAAIDDSHRFMMLSIAGRKHKGWMLKEAVPHPKEALPKCSCTVLTLHG